MKRKVLLLTSLLALVSLTGCAGKSLVTIEPNNDKATVLDNSQKAYPDDLILNHKVIGIVVGEEYQLSALQQANYDINNLTFTSGDANIATVTSKGKIKGIAAGETTIVVADKKNADFSKTVQVIVMGKPANADEAKIANHYKTRDESFLTSIVDHELYEKTIYKNGVMTSYNRYDQHITASYDDAYFGFYENDAEIKTADGGINFTNSEMIFNTNKFYDTYIYRRTGDIKRYYVAATQTYMEGPRSEPMMCVLDNIYTSGREVFTDIFGSAKLSKFSSNIDASSMSLDEKVLGFNGQIDGEGNVSDDNALVLSFSAVFEDTADQDDESRDGIPYGTEIPQYQKMRYIVKNNRVIASHIDVSMEYFVDVDENTRDQYLITYVIDHTYEDVDEDKSQIRIPDKKEYTKVDSLFGLF